MTGLNSFAVAASAGHSAFAFGDMIYQLLAFLVLLFLLKKYALGPVMKIMRDREQHVASEIETAERSNQEAKKLVEEQREMLKAARQEAAVLVENARKLGDEQKEEIIAAARAESNRLKEQAKQEIIQEREQAVAALREQVASLSVLIASKVIEKELTVADQEKLISDYIQEVGEGR